MSHILSAPTDAAIAFVSLSLLDSASLSQTAVSIIFASVIPIAGIIFIAKTERVDYDIPKRSMRIKPFIIGIINYFIGFILLLWLKTPVLMTGLMLAYVINTTIMLVITLYWKISIHAAGVTGPLTFIIYRLGLWSSFLYLLVIPVGLIRLKLKEHTLPQVIAGAILTILITWIQILFIIPIIPT